MKRALGMAVMYVGVILLTTGVYFAGRGDNLVVAGLLALATGVLTARIGSISAFGFEAPKGQAVTFFRFMQLLRHATEKHGVFTEDGELPLYAAIDGFKPVTGVFLAKFNGKTSMMLELSTPTQETQKLQEVEFGTFPE